MTPTFRKTYDLAVSIGGSCAAAFQIRHRGLRFFAGPFDWLGTLRPPSPFAYMAKCFGRGWDDFCHLENLEPEDRPFEVNGKIEYRYFDRASGMSIYHWFYEPAETPGVVEAAREKFFRRLQRLEKCFAEARHVLLVIATIFPWDFAEADVLLAALRKRFPATQFELRALQFGCPEACEEVVEGKGQMIRYERKLHWEYDMQLTATEWSFLDMIRLTGKFRKTAPRPKGLDSIKYRIWKHAGKQLKNAGFPFLGVKFPWADVAEEEG